MNVPATALVEAVKVTLCATPGVRANVAGFAVTPAGKPVIATITVPVNEFSAAAVTFTCKPAAPGVRVNVVGDADNVKSGGGTSAEMVAVMAAE